jgi:hypothetical protein
MNSKFKTSEPKKSPQKSETRFETKRELIGLYKQGPLEMNREFAERIVREFQEHQAKRNTARSKSE